MQLRNGALLRLLSLKQGMGDVFELWSVLQPVSCANSNMLDGQSPASLPNCAEAGDWNPCCFLQEVVVENTWTFAKTGTTMRHMTFCQNLWLPSSTLDLTVMARFRSSCASESVIPYLSSSSRERRSWPRFARTSGPHVCHGRYMKISSVGGVV